MSYDGLVSALHSPNIVSSDERKKQQELDNFWFHIQGFLIAIANISKILWPSGSCGKIPPKLASRGENLRRILSLNDLPSPLQKRKFRNFFEHYDIWIEDWHENSKDRILIDSNIGVIEYPSGTTPNPIAYMRNFNPEKFVLTFRDKEYNIKEVVKGIHDLVNKIQLIQSVH